MLVNPLFPFSDENRSDREVKGPFTVNIHTGNRAGDVSRNVSNVGRVCMCVCARARVWIHLNLGGGVHHSPLLASFFLFALRQERFNLRQFLFIYLGLFIYYSSVLLNTIENPIFEWIPYEAERYFKIEQTFCPCPARITVKLWIIKIKGHALSVYTKTLIFMSKRFNRL